MLHELANRAGHTALLVGGSSARSEVLARLDNAIRARRHAPVIEATFILTSGFEDRIAYARITPAAADLLGVDEITLLVIRPDGYIGVRADRNQIDALASYFDLLVLGRT